MFHFGGADEFHAVRGQAAMLGVDVVNAEMGHYPQGFLRRAVYGAMQPDVETDCAEPEDGKAFIIVQGMEGQAQDIAVESEHWFQVGRPDGDADYCVNHGLPLPLRAWIPACAGMTVGEFGMTVGEFGMTVEEFGMTVEEFGMAGMGLRAWIPACAGMTVGGIGMTV